MIRALLVDDDADNRDYLRELLRVQGDVEVIGDAGSISEAKALIAQHKPDLVFLDVEMPTPTKAPTLGQHTDEVLRQVLGYDDDRIAALRGAGALG